MEELAQIESIKYKFNIPSKLRVSLAKDVINSQWKKIIASIENKEVEEIVKVAKAFENTSNLAHPFKENTDTFPIKNIRKGMCNFIFFNDKKNQSPWILCQCTSFVDAIFTPEYSGGHRLSTNGASILKAAKKLIKDRDNICSIDLSKPVSVSTNYILDQTRPYHHFYDQLKWLIHLKTQKPINSNKSFFVPTHCKAKETSTKNKPTVSIFPLVIGSNQLGTQLDIYTDKMEKIVYEDSMNSLYGGTINYKLAMLKNAMIKSFKTKTSLTLWFGISGQKRIWVEQEDFLPSLVKQLTPWFKTFTFLIDGFTQYEDINNAPIQGSKETPINQDREVVDSIRQKLLPFPNVTVISLVGQTYRKKIQKCQSADFFIANAGAGQLVPHRFCKKPGILHSNERHCVFPMGINNTTVRLVDKSLVNDIGNLFAKGKKNQQLGSGLISYSIDIQVVTDMLIQMMNLSK